MVTGSSYEVLTEYSQNTALVAHAASPGTLQQQRGQQSACGHCRPQDYFAFAERFRLTRRLDPQPQVQQNKSKAVRVTAGPAAQGAAEVPSSCLAAPTGLRRVRCTVQELEQGLQESASSGSHGGPNCQISWNSPRRL